VSTSKLLSEYSVGSSFVLKNQAKSSVIIKFGSIFQLKRSLSAQLLIRPRFVRVVEIMLFGVIRFDVPPMMVRTQIIAVHGLGRVNSWQIIFSPIIVVGLRRPVIIWAIRVATVVRPILWIDVVVTSIHHVIVPPIPVLTIPAFIDINAGAASVSLSRRIERIYDRGHIWRRYGTA